MWSHGPIFATNCRSFWPRPWVPERPRLPSASAVPTATAAYSFGLKRVPFLDTFIIGSLFTIRVLLGIAAAAVAPSAWLLTFAMFFFFSLATAKRHTELRRAEKHVLKHLDGRGYNIEDQAVMLAFGVASAMASVLIVVIYLVGEVLARGIYRQPEWLWAEPIVIFLFVVRIWLLSHRGLMMDDPIAFALRDRASLSLGAIAGGAILLAF